MISSDALLDLHERCHRSFAGLLAHCRAFDSDALNRELEGFGYPSVRLQLHHALGAEAYWVGVLQGRVEAEDDNPRYPTVASLESMREAVSSATEGYLRRASREELNTVRSMLTWTGKERMLVPAQVILRTATHLFQHQGQVTAMCRLLGRPVNGLDYPIE